MGDKMPTWVTPWVALTTFALGVLLNMRPVFSWLQSIDATAIATMVSAAVGFGGVVVATRAGFQHLIASQEAQAQRDREAREFQSEASEKLRARERAEETRVLASALLGEMSAARTRVQNVRAFLAMQAAVYKSFGDTVSPEPVDVHRSWPTFDPIVFQANISKLGLLGPSTAGDVVEVYQLFSVNPMPPMKDMQAKNLALIFDAMKETIDSWLQDSYHVQRRLLALVSDANADPGPLYFNKQEREKAKTS
jgi:hypothetical protein